MTRKQAWRPQGIATTIYGTAIHYTHFISSLRLTFSQQGSQAQAVYCMQQLKEILKCHDIPLDSVNCTVEGWTEDTTFHSLSERLEKLRWDASLKKFMHPSEM